MVYRLFKFEENGFSGHGCCGRWQYKNRSYGQCCGVDIRPHPAQLGLITLVTQAQRIKVAGGEAAAYRGWHADMGFESRLLQKPEHRCARCNHRALLGKPLGDDPWERRPESAFFNIQCGTVSTRAAGHTGLGQCLLAQLHLIELLPGSEATIHQVFKAFPFTLGQFQVSVDAFQLGFGSPQLGQSPVNIQGGDNAARAHLHAFSRRHRSQGAADFESDRAVPSRFDRADVTGVPGVLVLDIKMNNGYRQGLATLGGSGFHAGIDPLGGAPGQCDGDDKCHE